MTISAVERRFLLGQVNTFAQVELDRLWQQASTRSDINFAAFILDAYPDLVDPFWGVASSLAATWFELSDTASPYVAVTAPPVPVERLRSSARWALTGTGDQGRRRLSGSLQRAVLDGARDTTLVNVERTGSNWARVARPQACAFCRLLATRGDAYKSSVTAARDVHDDCYCQPLEVRKGTDWTGMVDQDYLDTVEQWDTQYQKARAEAGVPDAKKILAAMRRLDVTDAK